jgi:uncharacterized protein YaiI (UPF0178 family)
MGVKKMHIFIDGDSCPVIDLTVKIAKLKNIEVTIVKSINHNITNDYANIITVDPDKESADFYIVNNANCGDIVISQDYGLAAMVIPKDISVITPRGLIVSDNNIDTLLHQRFMASQMRKQKRSFGSKNKKRTTSDDNRYINALTVLNII